MQIQLLTEWASVYAIHPTSGLRWMKEEGSRSGALSNFDEASNAASPNQTAAHGTCQAREPGHHGLLLCDSIQTFLKLSHRRKTAKPESGYRELAVEFSRITVGSSPPRAMPDVEAPITWETSKDRRCTHHAMRPPKPIPNDSVHFMVNSLLAGAVVGWCLILGTAHEVNHGWLLGPIRHLILRYHTGGAVWAKIDDE